MTTEQWELLQHVIDALRDPKSSPYYAMQFQEAADILASKLEEIEAIDKHEKKI